VLESFGPILDIVDAKSRNGTEFFEVSLGDVQLFACEVVNFFGTMGNRRMNKGI
jgi:hypothetical protein